VKSIGSAIAVFLGMGLLGWALSLLLAEPHEQFRAKLFERDEDLRREWSWGIE